MLLEFSTSADRSRFLDEIRASAPELDRFVKPSFSQAAVVAIRLATERDEQRIVSIARSVASVKIFEDVQMRALA